MQPTIVNCCFNYVVITNCQYDKTKWHEKVHVLHYETLLMLLPDESPLSALAAWTSDGFSCCWFATPSSSGTFSTSCWWSASLYVSGCWTWPLLISPRLRSMLGCWVGTNCSFGAFTCGWLSTVCAATTAPSVTMCWESGCAGRISSPSLCKPSPGES